MRENIALLISGLEKTEMARDISKSQRRSERNKCQRKSLKTRKATMEQQEEEKDTGEERNM